MGHCVAWVCLQSYFFHWINWLCNISSLIFHWIAFLGFQFGHSNLELIVFRQIKEMEEVFERMAVDSMNDLKSKSAALHDQTSELGTCRLENDRLKARISSFDFHIWTTQTNRFYLNEVSGLYSHILGFSQRFQWTLRKYTMAKMIIDCFQICGQVMFVMWSFCASDGSEYFPCIGVATKGRAPHSGWDKSWDLCKTV